MITGNIGCNASGIDGGELGWKNKARHISVYSETSDRWNEIDQLK